MCIFSFFLKHSLFFYYFQMMKKTLALRIKAPNLQHDVVVSCVRSRLAGHPHKKQIQVTNL
jgi:hypothetical protein